MSQSDRFDNFNGENEEVSTTPDAYTTESSEDIYNTPEVVAESAAVEEMPVAEIVAENVSATKTSDAVVPYNNQNSNQYSNNPYGNPSHNNNPYGDSSYNNNPYGNLSYDNNPYGNNPYGNGSYGNNPYNYNPYGGRMPQNDNQVSNPYNNNSYNNNQYSNNNQYNNTPYNNNQYNNQYNDNQYNTNQYNANQYGNNPYGNVPSGIPPYVNNQYSPYAMPPKKNKSGLIIGIVVAIIVLFLVAVFALIYRAFSLLSADKSRPRSDRSEYRFDYDEDDWRSDRNQRNTDPDDYFGNHYGGYDYDDWYDYDDYDYDDWYDDYGYDDYYYDHYYYNDSGKYYDFHDDIKHNLSYSVDYEYYRHDTDNDNVVIEAEYPVISGKNVANLDKLNGTIQDEVDSFIEFYDEQYANLIIDDDDYYEAYIVPYVTYMDEEKMSIVFDERISSDYYIEAYLYCINIDMEHGVVMNNENILSINDDFSVDFRERSDEQNGEISALTMMSDQQITRLFNSEQIIVFYTPMGMEIGFNYDEGWVTVTYEDYEQYLKVF